VGDIPTLDSPLSFVPLITGLASKINPHGAIVDIGQSLRPFVAWLPLVRGDIRTYPVLWYVTTSSVVLPYPTIFDANTVWRHYGDIMNRCDWRPTDYRPWATSCIPQDGAWVGNAEDYLLGVVASYSGLRPAFSTHCVRRRLLVYSRDKQILSPIRIGGA
jgi:hypothetical protein